MKSLTKKIHLSGICVISALLFLASNSFAADILEAATAGASGKHWNLGSQWTGTLVPTAGNNYVLYTNTSNSSGMSSFYGVSFGTGLLRTPTDASASVFLGDSLIIPPGTTLLVKEKDGGSASANIVFTNYNNVSTANLYPIVRLASSTSGGTVALSGTITNQCDSYIAISASAASAFIIDSTVTGTGNLTFVSSAGSDGTTYDSTATNLVTGDWSGFSGTMNIGNSTVAATVELNNSAVNVNMALAMPRAEASLQLDKAIGVKSFTITGNVVPTGSYTPAQLSALGFGGNFSGSGSLAVGFAPPSLVATPGIGQVGLSWQAVYGAVNYNVKRSTSSGAEVTIMNVTGTSFTDVGLVNGTTYYYKVSAVDGSSNESGDSTEVSAMPVAGPPTTPAWVSVTTGNPVQVSLSWTSSQATGYLLKRGTTGGVYDVTNVLSATDYVDTQVLSGVTYYYAVSATNVAGPSADSVETNVTPNAPPFTPTGLVVVNTDSGAVTLSWNDSFGATSYNIKRSTTSGAETTVNSSGTASFIDSGLANYTKYYYEVSAVGDGGESAITAETSIVTGFILEDPNGGGTGTDWTQGSQWIGGNPPTIGASYILYTNTSHNSGYSSYYGVSFGTGLLRTPTDNSASEIFGDSLIIPPGTTLLMKDADGGSASANIVFTNYNNISTPNLYPMVNLASSSSTLGGTVALHGTIANRCDSYIAIAASAPMTLVIDSTVTGTGNLTFISSAGGSSAGTTYDSTRTNLVTGDWSGFSGTMNIGNSTVAATVELNLSAGNTNMALTMANASGALVLDQTIYVAGFIIAGNSVPNGTYTPADLANLGYGGSFDGTGTLVVNHAIPSSPHINSLGLNGTSLALTATNGSASGVWMLLQSTNLALPLSQWETNTAGIFDSNGNLSTNIANVATNNLEFYILKVE